MAAQPRRGEAGGGEAVVTDAEREAMVRHYAPTVHRQRVELLLERALERPELSTPGEIEMLRAKLEEARRKEQERDE